MGRGLLEYLEARFELLALEWGEAKERARTSGGLLLLALGGAFFGYLLLLAFLTGLVGLGLAALLPESLRSLGWVLAALLLALLHLGAAFAAVRRIQRQRHTPLFEASRAEFEKDRAWIKDQQPPSEKRS